MPFHRWLLLVLAMVSCLAQTRSKRITPVQTAERQDFEGQVKVALLVGVGNYPAASGLSALKYPGSDVAALGAELERQGYLVRRLVDAEATRGSVRHTLHELAAALDPNRGTYLFFFSGHGFQQEGSNYLATFGTSVDDLKEEGLPLREVESMLQSSRARQTMMFVDACRNAPFAGARSVGARSFAALREAEGLRVLYSTRSGSVSYESEQLQQGVFTYFLVRGLRGEAAGADNLVTFRDLSDYVVDRVRAYGVRSGQVQVPFEGGESSGDFLVAGGAAGSNAASIAPMSPAISTPASPARTKVNPKDGLTYVWIPPGAFMMGCSPGDGECELAEKPTHRVTLTKGFWMGQTDVTQTAYRRVIGKNPSHFQGSNRPVECVNWNQAQNYCQAVGMRLPTEAEWEYAARAGSTQSRYGDIDHIAWNRGNSGNQTHEVAQKPPNAWGLYDMLGNVWQWTADWYGGYDSISEQDPKGPTSGQGRTLRGSSWADHTRAGRLSVRAGVGPELRIVAVGVRCVGN